MKLPLFLLVIAFSVHASAQRSKPAQSPRPDPIGDILDGLDAEAKKEEAAAARASAARATDEDLKRQAYAADQARMARERAARERMAIEARANANRERAAMLDVSRLATRAQAAVQPNQQVANCVPSYASRPYNEAEPFFAQEGFVGERTADGYAAPQIASVDFSSIAPHATHEMNLTAMVQLGSGWTTKLVTDSLAKTAKIFAACGIRIARATVVSSRLPYATSVINQESEDRISQATPKDSPKPWLYFVSHRADNPSQDGGGKSMAYISGTGDKTIVGSAWISYDSFYTGGKRNGYGERPELPIAHELAHLATDGGHNDASPNILNGAGQMQPVIDKADCAKMKANTKLVHPIR